MFIKKLFNPKTLIAIGACAVVGGSIYGIIYACTKSKDNKTLQQTNNPIINPTEKTNSVNYSHYYLVNFDGNDVKIWDNSYIKNRESIVLQNHNEFFKNPNGLTMELISSVETYAIEIYEIKDQNKVTINTLDKSYFDSQNDLITDINKLKQQQGKWIKIVVIEESSRQDVDCTNPPFIILRKSDIPLFDTTTLVLFKDDRSKWKCVE